ncbi:RNA polymerase sigma factor [bacterium]|nr:RNA polymerase sigma factor [bacterium]
MPNPPADLDTLLDHGYRYALSLTHDVNLSADLLQDACLGIIRRGGPWHLKYLITAIRNRFIDLGRRKQIVSFSSLKVDKGNSDHIEETYQRHDDGWDDELENALATLRQDEREVLYLAVVESFTADEIARLTNRPRGTILSLLHRTKQKLRNRLSKKIEGEK